MQILTKALDTAFSDITDMVSRQGSQQKYIIFPYYLRSLYKRFSAILTLNVLGDPFKHEN